MNEVNIVDMLICNHKIHITNSLETKEFQYRRIDCLTILYIYNRSLTIDAFSNMLALAIIGNTSENLSITWTPTDVRAKDFYIIGRDIACIVGLLDAYDLLTFHDGNLSITTKGKQYYKKATIEINSGSNSNTNV